MPLESEAGACSGLGWCSLQFRFSDAELQRLQNALELYALSVPEGPGTSTLEVASLGLRLHGITPHEQVSLSAEEAALLTESLRLSDEEPSLRQRLERPLLTGG